MWLKSESIKRKNSFFTFYKLKIRIDVPSFQSLPSLKPGVMTISLKLVCTWNPELEISLPEHPLNPVFEKLASNYSH